MTGRAASWTPATLANSGRVVVLPGPTSVLSDIATIGSIGVQNTGELDVVAGTLDLVSAPDRFQSGSQVSGFGRVRVGEGAGSVDAELTLTGPVAVAPSATFELAGG